MEIGLEEGDVVTIDRPEIGTLTKPGRPGLIRGLSGGPR